MEDGGGPEDQLMGIMGQHHHSQLEHIDDDECGGGGNEGDGDESELERYLRDIS
jgi:hypothetical protein